MSKKSDKLFHLTVTAFALALTAVSGITLVYEHSPDTVRNWIHLFTNMNLATPQPGPTASKPIKATKQGTGNVASSPAPSPSASPSQAALIKVIDYGHDMPASKVSEVNRLLVDAHIDNLVSNTLQMTIKKEVHVYLAQNASDYKAALKSLGVSVQDAQRFSHDTGGFTTGNNVVVPMYQNKTNEDLVNTLAHELTHAYLNENVHDIPSWVNEGLAVYDGMTAQTNVQDAVTYGGYVRQMAESVVDAAGKGTLVPLTGDESQVLEGSSPYDLELQDWLAVRYLMFQHGKDQVTSYLSKLSYGVSPETAFKQTFGMSTSEYNMQVTDLLKTAAKTADSGAEVALDVPSSFQGYARVLQHGSNIWHGFRLSGGHTTLTLNPDGTVSGFPGEEETDRDKNSPDTETVYIDLDFDNPQTYNGKKVQYCGFAIDYHYGMYGFVNGWVTYTNGKSDYIQDPKLFGVTLTDVTEVSKTDPIAELLMPSK